jgi:hypothetical protein
MSVYIKHVFPPKLTATLESVLLREVEHVFSQGWPSLGRRARGDFFLLDGAAFFFWCVCGTGTVSVRHIPKRDPIQSQKRPNV